MRPSNSTLWISVWCFFLDFDGVLHPNNCGPHEQFCYMGNFVDAMRLADTIIDMQLSG
jgi:hypothetical protein